MDSQAGKSSSYNAIARQGETIKAAGNGHGLQEITCDNIARLALAMYDHSHFFSLRRGLSIQFSRDLNGSGTQGLFIKRKSDEINHPSLIEVIFRQSYKKDSDFLYEADLIMDQRKDYEPTVNKGKHGFLADAAHLQIEWSSEELEQWRSDVDRLSKSPETLNSWIEADLEMLVRCRTGYFCREAVILTKSDLAAHAAAGLSLQDLERRLTCSKCGQRGAKIKVF